MRVLLTLVAFISLFNGVGLYAQEGALDEAVFAQTEGAGFADVAEEVIAPTENVPAEEPAVPEAVAPAPAESLEPEPTEAQEPAEGIEAPDKGSWNEIKGIDTVDIDEPQGNWLLKRIWWEKAEAKYEKIKATVEQILDSRMVFFEKHKELDRNVFDPFYMDVGLSQGELQEIIEYFKGQIEEIREKDEVLNMQERDLLRTLNEEQGTIEQLTKDAQAIGEYDMAINEALATLMEQMNLCRKYERESWDAFKAIAKELSDKRARELYYSMETSWKNINNIKDYVANVFGPHFNGLAQQVQEHTEKVKSALEMLKEKGVDVKKQAEILDKFRRQEAPGMSPGVDEDDDEDEDVQPVPRGWFSWFWDLWEAVQYWWSGVA